jgi:hypothetical protein
MKSIECTRLMLLAGSEYPHANLRLTPPLVWQAILADISYPLGCEALQDYVDADPGRGRMPQPGQIRELAIRLKPTAAGIDREWTPLRIGSFWFKARVSSEPDAVTWAAYGLRYPALCFAGTAPSLIAGFDAVHRAIAQGLRFMDSVRVDASVLDLRALTRMVAR